MVYDGKGITILVTISVAPENVPVFLEALHECVNNCVKEPECERFEVFQSSTEGTFYLVETWRESKDWLIQVRLTIQLGLEQQKYSYTAFSFLIPGTLSRT
jgi:hypothetical protein